LARRGSDDSGGQALKKADPTEWVFALEVRKAVRESLLKASWL
jgi:hypothetical protein